MDSGVWLLVVLVVPLNGDGLIMGGSQPHPNEDACRAAKAEALNFDPAWRRAQHYVMARCTPK
jgi:hypothetical protein